MYNNICVDTFTFLWLLMLVLTPNSAVNKAKETKHIKYTGLTDCFIFKPVVNMATRLMFSHRKLDVVSPILLLTPMRQLFCLNSCYWTSFVAMWLPLSRSRVEIFQMDFFKVNDLRTYTFLT